MIGQFLPAHNDSNIGNYAFTAVQHDHVLINQYKSPQQPGIFTDPAMLLNFLYTFSGILLLYAGAELLVRGSVSLSWKFNVTPMLTGLVVVGLGTSSPELVVSIQATLQGSGEIAAGNIIGSNISNLALVMGIAALIFPLHASASLLRREVPVMITVSLLLTLLLFNGFLGRIDAGILLIALLIYLVCTIRNNLKPVFAEEPQGFFTRKSPILITASLAGLTILLIGANLMVAGASGIARQLDVGEGVIGLTVVAIGTSLPELATAVVAAVRKQGDLILGALIGSNILNILFVLGITATVTPIVLVDIMTMDLVLMSLLAILMIPVIRTGYVVSRLEGAFLLAGYIIYVTFLFVR